MDLEGFEDLFGGYGVLKVLELDTLVPHCQFSDEAEVEDLLSLIEVTFGFVVFCSRLLFLEVYRIPLHDEAYFPLFQLTLFDKEVVSEHPDEGCCWT